MRLRCLASTGNTFHGTADDAIARENARHAARLKAHEGTEYTFPPLQQPPRKVPLSRPTPSRLTWLQDGASLFCVSEDNGMRLYTTSATLLEDTDEPLVPFTRSFHSTPIITTELHPDASPYSGACPVLVSSNDLPLKLMDLIPPSDNGKPEVLSVYNTQHNHTERYFKLHSLKFLTPDIFATGMSKSISLFDIRRNDPVLSVQARGIVSCFETATSEFRQGTFYAGTLSNWVSVHDANGNRVMEKKVDSGKGVSQILESDNGRYLFIITRNSHAISVFDIRMGLGEVEQLPGFSSTSQRLFGSVLHDSQGLIIGTSTGNMNLYADAEMGYQTLHSLEIAPRTSVSSVAVNPKEPTVVAYGVGDRGYELSEIKVSLMEKEVVH